jgi:hypothetical protein
MEKHLEVVYSRRVREQRTWQNPIASPFPKEKDQIKDETGTLTEESFVTCLWSRSFDGWSKIVA